MSKWSIGLALGLFFLSVDTANAQYQPYRSSYRPNYQRPQMLPYERPTLSPYSNLLDSGANFEFEYFRRVRPELEFRKANAAFRQQFDATNRRIENESRRLENQFKLGGTGHRASFLNYGGYYPGLR